MKISDERRMYVKKGGVMPKGAVFNSGFKYAFLMGIFSVLCGCASLPAGFLSQKYLHQKPSEQEAEVYRKIIRDYAVGDWLYEIGGEGGNHVDRAYFQSREGNISLSPEDMEHAKRLIKSVTTFRVSGIYQDCWLSGMFDTDYESCIRRNESGGRMPFPKCLAFYGYPVSKNHKSPDAYFKEAGIRTAFFEGDLLEKDSEKRLERELKEAGFDLGGSWLSDFRATLKGKSLSQLDADLIKISIDQNRLSPGFISQEQLRRQYKSYIKSKIIERGMDDLYKMRDELAAKIEGKKVARESGEEAVGKSSVENAFNFAQAFDGVEDGIEVPSLHILFGPIRTISEKEMKERTAVCLKTSVGTIKGIELHPSKYPEDNYTSIYWIAYSKAGKRYFCNTSPLVEEKDKPVTCSGYGDNSDEKFGREELDVWYEKRFEEFSKNLEKETAEWMRKNGFTKTTNK